MREPKPHVVSFLAALLLLAGVSTVVDRPDRSERVAITVDPVTGETTSEVVAGADPSPVANPDGTTSTDGTGTSPDGTVVTTGTTPGAAGGTGPSGQSGKPTGGSGTSGSSGGNAGTPATPRPSAAPGTPAAPSKYPEAPLFDDKEKFRGFTDTDIVMCGHAALALGAAFDTSREDLNVYWDMLNESGGIHGRKITMTWEDDAYVSDVAVRAATTCADKNPFMILGGIGFDQIPGVRTWAEQNQELYMHHIAVAPQQTYNYSFSLQPTVEIVGTEAGKFIAREHRAEKIGVMYRSTANWSPGSTAAMEVMESHQMDVTGYPVFQNQGTYANEINQMKLNGTTVVFLWENALAAANILNQASEQDYYPTWVVFPFQQTIDLLTEPDAHKLEGVATWGSYVEGGYGGAFAEFGVDAEIKRFEAAYAKFRPETTTNDILWQVWVGNKVLDRMLSDCGSDCNRNRFAGMMLSGYQAQELPGCQINFADPRSLGGHHGGFRFFSQRTFAGPNGAAFETTRYCASTLG